ncbi:MAG: hypothetical protein D6798_17060 [Deltaproteobacteria bacterium]|nr:MAG: hypothetical protein D6798_17060 [Deltaproteobacteria bacterium]
MHRVFALLPPIVLLACAGGTESRVIDRGAPVGDTGAPQPQDDALDTGDAGGVTLGDDGGSGDSACTLDDLQWDAGVRRSDDPPDGSRDQLHEGEPVTAVGRVSNPCDGPVTIEQPERCLVSGFDLVEVETGTGRYQALDCYESTRQTELDSGESAETALDWGQLDPGDYLLTAHFAVDGRVATTTFIVR